MPILNYTTTISPIKTVGEIQEILARAGVTAVQLEYAGGEPTAVKFRIAIQDRFLDFRLPSRWQGVHKTLTRDTNIEKRYRSEEQAKRVAWRIIKDWVEAQIALVQAGVAEMAEVFLPYAANPQTGQTFYENFITGLQLPEGEKKA